jgi:hypothetical protein
LTSVKMLSMAIELGSDSNYSDRHCGVGKAAFE